MTAVLSWARRSGGPRIEPILLEGQNVKPKRTLEAGYRFRYTALDDAMTDLVHITFCDWIGRRLAGTGMWAAQSPGRTSV